MKLNNSHRDAFVAHVMQDVPSVDFQAQFEAAVRADNLKVVPAKIAEVLRDTALSHFVLTGMQTYGRWESGVSSVAVSAGYVPTEAGKAELDGIVAAAADFAAARHEMESKLRGTIYACSTLKVALERLPEFAKYLPTEVGRTLMLPAIANLTAELIRMGWPKEQPDEA